MLSGNLEAVEVGAMLCAAVIMAAFVICVWRAVGVRVEKVRGAEAFL